MNQSKEQSQEIIDPDRPGCEFFLEQIAESSYYDRQRDQELYPLCIETYHIKYTQCERQWVTDRKRRYQYQYLFPVFQQVDRDQCRNKELVIQCIPADNMFPS